MANYNRVILIGRLTRDPEYKQLQNTEVANFSLAVSESYKDKDGNKKEEVSFIDCEVWGKRAGVINQYTKKGNELQIEGRLRQDTWESDGQKRSKLVVKVDDFNFIGNNNNSSDEEPAQKRQQSTQINKVKKQEEKVPWND